MELANIIVAAVAAILSLGSLSFSVYTYRKALVHDRKQATLDAYLLLQEQAFDPLNHIMPSEIEEIVMDPRSARYKDLSGYVARIEHFCVGVNRDIYDRDTVYALAHGYIDKALTSRLDPILNRKAALSGQEYYENIKEVLRWMAEKEKTLQLKNSNRRK